METNEHLQIMIKDLNFSNNLLAISDIDSQISLIAYTSSKKEIFTLANSTFSNSTYIVLIL